MLVRHQSTRLLVIALVCVLVLAVAVSLYSGSLPFLSDVSRLGVLGFSSSGKGSDSAAPPPTSPPFGAVVAAGYNGLDLSWMNTLEPDWLTYPYNNDLPNNEDVRLRIPVSKGNEAMPYLSYIIDNYDNLPWITIFAHGHRDTWHQEHLIDDLIRSLNLTAVAAAGGYVNLRCTWSPGCPTDLSPAWYDFDADRFAHENEIAIASAWPFLFPHDELPLAIAGPCCAQFALTRQKILARPKADYVRMRKWLIDTLLPTIVSGRVFEKLWSYIFTGEAVYCPAEEKCSCELFGRCGPQPPPVIDAFGSTQNRDGGETSSNMLL